MPPHRAAPLSPTRPKCPVKRNVYRTKRKPNRLRPPVGRRLIDSLSTTDSQPHPAKRTACPQIIDRFSIVIHKTIDNRPPKRRTRTVDRVRANIVYNRSRNEDSETSERRTATENGNGKTEQRPGHETLRKKDRKYPAARSGNRMKRKRPQRIRSRFFGERLRTQAHDP